ncbi:hypothetical protein [Methylocaldum szegediense]|uniref:hypothetical protein n=1 Tax=Methylocaldum szegediense TaxID=73780 RepID=UPI00041B72FF|nr:hypothetical protein [Methylocaldum szegediense]
MGFGQYHRPEAAARPEGARAVDEREAGELEPRPSQRLEIGLDEPGCYADAARRGVDGKSRR